jgi:hypothetical protein
MRHRHRLFAEDIVMSRIGPVLYGALAHVVFFGIRMRLANANLPKRSGQCGSIKALGDSRGRSTDDQTNI